MIFINVNTRNDSFNRLSSSKKFLIDKYWNLRKKKNVKKLIFYFFLLFYLIRTIAYNSSWINPREIFSQIILIFR